MNILSKETLIEYKKLRKNNPEIEGVQEFFRDYVKSVGEDFSVEHVGIIEAYYNDLKTYHKVLKDSGLNLSIEETKLLILGQSLDEFKKMLKNEKIIFLMKNGNIENLKLFFGENGVIKNIDDLKKLIDTGIISYLVSYINYDKNLISAYKKGFSFNNIGGNIETLFPVDTPGSKTLDEIIKLMKIQPDKDIHEILRKTAEKYLKKNEIEKQEKGDKEISIYLRYGQIVDYPEIGETIIIFLQEALKKGIIKGVKGIKILPRIKYITPRNNIIDENTRICNVEGDDFIKELNNNSIPFYLSHSSNESNGFCITSGSMKTKYGQINLGLELEDFSESKTQNKNINEIFDILMGIIEKINEKKD